MRCLLNYLLLIISVLEINALVSNECLRVPLTECCKRLWSERCPQPQCSKQVNRRCPERKPLIQYALHSKDLRRAPEKVTEAVSSEVIGR